MTGFPKPVERKRRKNRVRSRITKEKRALEMELDALLSQFVRTRDGWKCVFCGSSDRPQAMHLLGKGAHPRLRFEPMNLRTGCYACHLGSRGWHNDSTPYWSKLEPGLRERLEIADRCAPKVDLKLLLCVWRQEVARMSQ